MRSHRHRAWFAVNRLRGWYGRSSIKSPVPQSIMITSENAAQRSLTQPTMAAWVFVRYIERPRAVSRRGNMQMVQA